MAKVQVLNVAVLDNPSPFGNPFQFEITFECMEDLPEGRHDRRKAVVLRVSEAKALSNAAASVCVQLLSG